MAELKYQTGEEYYNKIYLVFNALIAFTLIPFVLLFLDIQKNGSEDKIVEGTPAIFLSTVLVALFVTIFGLSLKNHKKGLSKINREYPLRQKLNNYYWVSFQKYLGLSICCIIAILGILFTKYFLFIIGYIFSLATLSIGRPVLNGIPKEIPLSQSEIGILNNKTKIE